MDYFFKKSEFMELPNMNNKKIYLALSIAALLSACATPEKTKAHAMTAKPLNVCNDYNEAVELNNPMAINVLKNVIEERKINCQTYKNELAILANQRFLRTLVGP